MQVRILVALSLFSASACSERITSDQAALIANVEKRVAMPKGAGDLKCYERHYSVLRDKEVDTYLGFHLSRTAGRSLLVGTYRFGGHPGVYWTRSTDDLPRKIEDGGCDDIGILHMVGDPERSIPAMCSTTMAGSMPDQVNPPRRC